MADDVVAYWIWLNLDEGLILTNRLVPTCGRQKKIVKQKRNLIGGRSLYVNGTKNK